MPAAVIDPKVILLVEDSGDLRELIAHWLTDAGHRVMATASAEEAQSTIALRGFPDVLATDYHLQGMTGYELARRFRRMKPGMPALIFSGDPPELPLEPGMVILTKPFGPSQLHEKLRLICS